MVCSVRNNLESHSKSSELAVFDRPCIASHLRCELWRPEFELDGINSGSWYHCLPIGIYHWLGEGGWIAELCVRSSMLHGSETWPVRKEYEVALQRAEMRMVRWMCNVKVKDRVPWKELRERLGIDNNYNIDTTAKQVAMVWVCVAKTRHWLVEEMYGIWGGGLQIKR